MDVSHSLKVIGEVKVLAVDAVLLAKKGVSFSSLGAVLAMISEAHMLMSDAKLVMPELKDVDTNEAGQLAAAGYDLVKSVMAAVVG